MDGNFTIPHTHNDGSGELWPPFPHTIIWGRSRRFTLHKVPISPGIFPLPPDVLPVRRELGESARCFVFYDKTGWAGATGRRLRPQGYPIPPHQEYTRVQSSRWQYILSTISSHIRLIEYHWNRFDVSLWELK